MQETGIKSLDALHVATAEAAGAAWFITVDNRLIRVIAAGRIKDWQLLTRRHLYARSSGKIRSEL